MVQNYTADLKHALWSLQSAGSLLHSQSQNGNMSFREWRSTLMPFSPDCSPPLLTTKLPLPLETLTSPSVVVSPPRLSKLTETGPLPGIPLLWPSSVLSPTRPLSCNNTLNTFSSFSGALPYSHSKVINFDKAIHCYTGEVKHINLSEVGRFWHLEAHYLQEDSAGNHAGTHKEKEVNKSN
jgi:hypothetical protein